MGMLFAAILFRHRDDTLSVMRTILQRQSLVIETLIRNYAGIFTQDLVEQNKSAASSAAAEHSLKALTIEVRCQEQQDNPIQSNPTLSLSLSLSLYHACACW
jgi:cytochrome c-type biogenesis protein CcmH/NrfF